MYKKALARFAMGLCLLGGIAGARAASVELGTLNPGGLLISDVVNHGGAGFTYTDTFTFDLGSVTSGAASGVQITLNLGSANILNGTFTSVSLDSGLNNYLNTAPNSSSFNVTVPNLTPNAHYTLTVQSETATGYTASSYFVALAAPVPIPAALPLFGSALAFAGIFSFVRRRPRS
jgi:hypothetical protein